MTNVLTLFAQVLSFDDVFDYFVASVALRFLPGDDAGLGEDLGNFNILWLLWNS